MSAGKKVVLLEIDPALAQREIEDFLIRKILGAGASGGVVGLSGGVDSTLVAYLAASAFRRHNAGAGEGKKRLSVLGLIMPSNVNHPADERDAREVAATLEIERDTVPIAPLIDAFKGALSRPLLDDQRHVGNLASELRAVILSRCAAARGMLVLGTGNKDEDYSLGYFTKRGDGAVDISPIGSLSKRHVRILAAHMGVPSRIVNKVPSAGLWPGQTDEGELGFSYDFAEFVLTGTDQGIGPDEVARQAGCKLEDVERVLRLHRSSRHKMSPPAIAPVTYTNGPKTPARS